MIDTIHTIIKDDVIVEQTIQKSKFITYLAPVADEEAAKEFLRRVKKEHPKATHHCSAYRVLDIERSNDDGEPASTAGMPMLQALRSANLVQVIAVVVRYYGGTLLGTGGLIRAYGSSVSLALEHAHYFAPVVVYAYECVFPYSAINDMEVFINKYGVVIEREYRENVYYSIHTKEKILVHDFADVTRGSGTLTLKDQFLEYMEVMT